MSRKQKPPRFSFKSKQTARVCPVCWEPQDRWGWCDGCKAIRAAIDAALSRTDDIGSTDRDGDRVPEAFDSARRMELHRERAAGLRLG